MMDRGAFVGDDAGDGDEWGKWEGCWLSLCGWKGRIG